MSHTPPRLYTVTRVAGAVYKRREGTRRKRKRRIKVYETLNERKETDGGRVKETLQFTENLSQRGNVRSFSPIREMSLLGIGE